MSALPQGAARASYQLPPLPHVELDGGLGLSDFSSTPSPGPDEEEDQPYSTNGSRTELPWGHTSSRKFLSISTVIGDGDP